jgi:uncharacterized protein YjaG (DUF416 family)
MKTFDELLLVQRLAALRVVDCTAFALSAASRQIQNYKLYAKRVNLTTNLSLENIAESVWDNILGGGPPKSQCDTFLSEMMAFAAEESEELCVWGALADDAIASLCYTVRHLLNGDPQEAAWAARRSYNAADQAATKLLDIDLVPESEKQILSHPTVQRELSRQERDIGLLKGQSGRGLLEVKRLSTRERFLDHSEVVLLG